MAGMTIELSEYVIDAIAEAVVKKMQEPCDNAINRQAVMDCFKKWQPYMATRLWDFEQELSNLPSVKQEPKTGHWIGDNQAFWIYAKCSECGSVHNTATNYCPDCGCLMDRTEFDEYVKTEGA